MIVDFKGLPASAFIGLQSGWSMVNGKINIPKNTPARPGSYLRVYYTTYPGDEIEIEYDYKVVSGSYGLVYLEGHTQDNYNSQEYSHGIKNSNKEWTRVKEKYVVPETGGVKYSRVSMGVGYNEGATVEYRNLVINIHRANTGKNPNIFAVGTLRKQSNNTIVLSENVMNTGVISASVIDNYSVSVVLEDAYSSALITHPFVFITGSIDSPLIPLIGQFTRNNNGTINAIIKWSNGTSFVDVSGLTLFITLYAFR